jgi:hypothetical protein
LVPRSLKDSFGFENWQKAIPKGQQRIYNCNFSNHAKKKKVIVKQSGKNLKSLV